MKAVEEIVSRRERRKEETRLKIIQAALALLSEKPFDQITVEEITERADVAKGTFFRYFPTKESILVAYVQDLVEEVHTQIHQIVEQEGMTRQGSAWVILLQIAKSVASAEGRSRIFSRTLFSVYCLNKEVAHQIHRMHEGAISGCAKLIRYGQATGEFRTDYPAEELARYIIRLYTQCVFEWCMRADTPALPELVEATLRFFQPAICAKEVRE